MSVCYNLLDQYLFHPDHPQIPICDILWPSKFESLVLAVTKNSIMKLLLTLIQIPTHKKTITQVVVQGVVKKARR